METGATNEILGALLRWSQQKSKIDVLLIVVAAIFVLYLSIKVARTAKELSGLSREVDLATNRFQVVAGDLRELLNQFDATFADKVSLPTKAEVASPPAQVAPTDDNWERFKQIWDTAKQAIEARIESIADGRKLRKYANFSRRSYYGIIDELVKDGFFNAAEAEATRHIYALYLRHRSRHLAVAAEIEEQAMNSLITLYGHDPLVGGG
jgi:hypothetical protein